MKTLDSRLRTFGSVLDLYKGIGPGFDALRISLSILILCVHSASITGFPEDPMTGPTRYVTAALVPAFFALSGFLVIASAIRSDSLATFITFRGLRILPALVTEVVVTALLIGPIVTSIQLSDYFSNPEFFAYFQNLIGNIHYHLPGVFRNNPMTPVNASLWTIRPEIVCYIVLALIILTKLKSNITFYVCLTLALFVAIVSLSVAQSTGTAGMNFAAQAKYFFFFIVGNLAYLLRHKIPFSWPTCAISAIASALLLQAPGWEIVAALPLVYCIVFLGLVKIPMPKLLAKGDYSYGIYLFSYPVQQLVASFPETRLWYVNILIALPITLAVAAVSWHLIEKPFLSLKKTLRVPAEVERTVLTYPFARAFIAFCLVAYGVVVSTWAGLYGAFGTSLRSHLVATFFAVGACAILIAWWPRFTTARPAVVRSGA
jgi:peptidoglycan/LPS O-acetylase OafA/YrhL